MIFEYLTVEYSTLSKPLKFRFADDSGVVANHLHAFLNRQDSLGWELLSIMPLAYVPFETEKVRGLYLDQCRLIFRRSLQTSTHTPDTVPPPSGKARRLKPV